MRDIVRQDLYGFASIHFSVERKFEWMKEGDQDEDFKEVDQDFHAKVKPIQTCSVSINQVNFHIKKELDGDSRSVTLHMELKPPDMGFYGPPKKVVGFKAALGPEETEVRTSSVNYLKDAAVRVNPECYFDFRGDEAVMGCEICVDHTLCLTLEEEVVIAVVADDDDGVGGGGGNKDTGHFKYTPEQLGEQLWVDLASGMIKERHLVSTRKYIGNQLPVSQISLVFYYPPLVLI